MMPLQKRLWIFVSLVAWQSTLFGDVKTEDLRGREAVVMTNDRIRVSVFPGGGHIGEVSLISEDPKLNINPFWVPHYQTIEPQNYKANQHGRVYGSGDDSRISSGYMGHFLCFPYLGGLSQQEKDQGLGAHGEAAVVEWKIEHDKAREARGDGTVLQMGASLPISKYEVKRSLQVVDGESVLYVEETVSNQVGFDRPFQWVQHVTFGAPFIETGKNKVDAPVRAPVWNQDAYLYQEVGTNMWPIAEDLDGTERDLRTLEVKEGEGTYRAWLLDDSKRYTWFTMYHTEYKLLIGYLMPARWNPWVGDWQENKFMSRPPWNKEAVARGILIGTSPFTGGIRRSIDTGPFYGKETVRWIGAKESIYQRYAIFLAEIPAGFKGVESLNVVRGFVHLKERETARLISIKMSELE